MSGDPYPRPPSSRKPSRLTKEEARAQKAWKIVPVGCDPHHILYEQVLRKHGYGDKVYDLRNRMVLPRSTHARHHAGFAPIARHKLTDAAWEFALELDGGDREGYFTDWLYRNYPIGEVEASADLPGECSSVSGTLALASTSSEPEVA